MISKKEKANLYLRVEQPKKNKCASCERQCDDIIYYEGKYFCCVCFSDEYEDYCKSCAKYNRKIMKGEK